MSLPRQARKALPSGKQLLGALSTTTGPTIDNVDIATVINQQSLPFAIQDGGGTIVVWEDTRGGPSDIYAQKLTQGSAALWQTDGLPVCKADGSQRYPRAVSDGAGGAIVVWQDGRNDGGDIYAQRLGPQGNPLWTPNGVPICTSQFVQAKPVIVADGLGGAYIAWQDDRVGATNSDVWVQRVNGAGSLILGDCGIPICTAAGPQQGLNIISDGLRGAILVWQDGRTDAGDIRAQRLDEHGFVVWTVNGVLVCGASNTQENPAAVIDNAGGAIITWSDGRNGNRDIYAQRINAGAGASQWTANGEVVCTQAGDQRFPQICEDAVGGGIITWQDARSGVTGIDIYAQRVNPTGAMQWTPNGVAVCTALLDQIQPVIEADPMGGSIIGWSDARIPANGQDVYAQHLNGSGASLWTANGVQLCDAPDSQDAVRLVPTASAAPRWSGRTSATERATTSSASAWTPTAWCRISACRRTACHRASWSPRRHRRTGAPSISGTSTGARSACVAPPATGTSKSSMSTRFSRARIRSASRVRWPARIARPPPTSW
jgi:hypothetical protein